MALPRPRFSLLITKVALLSLVVFLFDFNYRLGAAAGILYLVPVLLSSRSHNIRVLMLTSAGCSVLVSIHIDIFGFANYAEALLQHLPAIFVIWTAALFIADRIRYENSMLASEKRLGVITDSVPGAVYQFLRTTEGENRLLLMSRGIEDLLEVERVGLDELFGQFYASVLPEDRPAYLNSIAEAADKHAHWSHDFRLRMPRGTIKWVRGTSIPESPRADGSVIFNGLLQDITDARNLSDELSRQAKYDGLTGLVNRRSFEQRLQSVLSMPADKRSEVVLAYLDLDQFKVINDTCGHVAGDELLRQLALMLGVRLRSDDTLARLGGDEFGILMLSCSMEQAHRAMERVREVIAEFRFVWEGKTFNVGVSIGLVLIDAYINDVSAALKRADAACYAAKDAGRNRVNIYTRDDAYLTQRHGEMQWVSRLNRSLESSAFELHAQRIMNVANPDPDTDHYEILIRMQDDDGTLIPPGAFLPAAERYNLSPKLDRWVVKTVFEWLASDRRTLSNAELYCVNLSALSLGDKETLLYIVDLLHELDIPAHKIGFEVTETATITNLTNAMHFITTLKAKGCKFSLDDFGSGFSSFGYLKTLPVDYLKIDGMFVKNVLADAIDLAMVKSINEIGHLMGMKTVAEFVENEHILAKLKEIGVDYAQGYGIARPRPLAELINCQSGS